MKDLTIKAATLKREGTILLILFGVAVIINIYAIITLGGNFIELFTQIGWTVVITLVLYLVLAIIRGIVYGVKYFKNNRSARAA